MKRWMIAAAVAVAALSMAACNGLGGVLAPDRGALEQTVLDEKAMIIAEVSIQGVNLTAEAALDAGLLKPGSPRATGIADGLDDAKAALDLARAAYDAGDAKAYGDKIAAIQRLVAAAWALTPKKEESS